MNSEEEKIIVVVGATGRQGREVVRQLVGHGWRVKGVTRNPESKKAMAIRALGAELVPADLDDITTLESAFQGAYGVYTMQPPILGRPENEIQQGKKLNYYGIVQVNPSVADKLFESDQLAERMRR